MTSNMLGNLFGQKTRIVCPRCLKSIQVSTKNPQETICSECRFKIPKLYVAEYNTSLPVFIQLFGWPSVGKTMYLDVLRLHLYDMDQVWDGYFNRPATDLDLSHREILATQRA